MRRSRGEELVMPVCGRGGSPSLPAGSREPEPGEERAQRASGCRDKQRRTGPGSGADVVVFHSYRATPSGLNPSDTPRRSSPGSARHIRCAPPWAGPGSATTTPPQKASSAP